MEASISYDLGLRTFLNAVYTRMGLGLLVTALLAWVASIHPISDLLYSINSHGVLTYSLLGLIVSIAPILLILGVAANASRETSGIAFWGTAACFGLSMGVIVMKFSGLTLATAFLETAITFGAMSLFGYTTKRNLGGMGNFLFFALIGVLVALIAGIFLHSTLFQLTVNLIGILVFAGFVAYDTQRMRDMYEDGYDGYDVNMAALSLYLDFINIFVFILDILGIIDKD